MFIAIPSYGRALTCKNKTIRTLDKMGIDKNIITIYVVEEQAEEYHQLMPDYNIAIGVKGIVSQRQFILEQYPKGTHLVYMDDDLDEIDLSMSPYSNLLSFLEDAFIKSVEQGAYLWGVYAVYNPFFRKARTDISTCLNFCIGCLYGIITRPNNHNLDIILSTQGNKEDVERSLRYFIEDGIVLRFNKISFKTKFFGKGGIGEKKERKEISNIEAHKLAEAFPQYGKIKIRKNGFTEFNLKKLTKRI